MRRALVLCLAIMGLYLLSSAALIKAKAWLAPVLIATAWEKTLESGVPGVKPWSWADTWPVARLRSPGQGVDLLVLAGGTGNALAFGPGHVTASAPLGAIGLAVIGGHRDTHFAFLRQLVPGGMLQLQLPSGRLRNYEVRSTEMVDTRLQSLQAQSDEERLLLVTCYPFDAISPGGPLRYVVSAIPSMSKGVGAAVLPSAAMKLPRSVSITELFLQM